MAAAAPDRGAAPTWTAVEGLIGAGKTTTTGLVGTRGGIQTLFEHIERHPLLPEYYSDPALYALETELVFSALRLHEIKRHRPTQPTVSDFAPAKTLIFAGLSLDEVDLAFVTDAHEHLWRGQPRPDLVIFLDVPPEACLDRIRRRARPFERGITDTFLHDLRAAYLEALPTLAPRVEHLRLSGDESAEEIGDRASALVARGPAAAAP